VGTIHCVLHEDLGLEKKSARWVPKLLSQEQKIQRVEDCRDFIAAVHRHSFTMLDNIVTMDETMVSYHMLETKKQSKQWIAKGKPGPIKARVQASRLFMKQLKKKWPAMVAQQWWFHWDNAPVHTAAVVQEWLAAHGVQVIRHLPYSPDLALADFFSIPESEGAADGPHVGPEHDQEDVGRGHESHRPGGVHHRLLAVV
jgi:histone-lysine N-methyltransferase SETMAR